MIQEIKEKDVIHHQGIKELDAWVEYFRSFTKQGKSASYIPALVRNDPSQLGICVMGPDGTKLKSGDWDVPFTLQSISKVISFIIVCLHHGIDYVLERVDVEPTGDAFNSIMRLEMHSPGKPFNPMINAGAITISSLLPGRSAQEKLASLLTFMEKILGKCPAINEEVFQSEWETANRNRSLAYYLKDTGFLESEVDESLEVYLKQCAIEVNTEDIALIGLVLAQDGYHPIRKEQIFPKKIARLTKSLMTTCGMYNASGKFAAFIGIPAKSGVSGGIMALVPPRNRQEVPFPDGCGIGVYGPAIDEVGNSVAGVKLLSHLSEKWDLSIF